MRKIMENYQEHLKWVVSVYVFLCHPSLICFNWNLCLLFCSSPSGLRMPRFYSGSVVFEVAVMVNVGTAESSTDAVGNGQGMGRLLMCELFLSWSILGFSVSNVCTQGSQYLPESSFVTLCSHGSGIPRDQWECCIFQICLWAYLWIFSSVWLPCSVTEHRINVLHLENGARHVKVVPIKCCTWV